MTSRDGSKARASAICISLERIMGTTAQPARKSGGQVAISAAKPRDFKALPRHGEAVSEDVMGEKEDGKEKS